MMHTTTLVIAIVAMLVVILPTLGTNLIPAFSIDANDTSPAHNECQLYQQQPGSTTSNNFSALANQSNSLNLKERIWMTARQIGFEEASYWVAHSTSEDAQNTISQPVIRCMALDSNSLGSIPKIAVALQGAVGCKKGTETCKLSSGFSDPISPFEFSISISKAEAVDIASKIPLVDNLAVLQDDNNFYLVTLHTTSEDVAPQGILDFGNSTYFSKANSTSIHLEKGQSITIPFKIKTFATYGKPANITLVTGVNAQDSGLSFRINPGSTFLIPERSSANASVTISAPSASALDGIYRFFITSKNFQDSNIRCGDFTNCEYPGIQVANSSWIIFTSNGGIGMGGKTAPEWLTLVTETDNDAYRQDQPIVIKSYLVNNGTNSVKLDYSRLIVDIGNATILPDPNSSTTSLHVLYTIDALHQHPLTTGNIIFGNETIVIPPHSKYLIARPFIWDQSLAGAVTSDGPARIGYQDPFITAKPPLVNIGNYTIETSFAGPDGYVLYSNKNIQITNPAGSYASDVVNLPPKPEVWGSASQQSILAVAIGAGAIIAGVVAVLTIRNAKRN